MALQWGFSDQQQQFASMSAKIAADNVTTFAAVKTVKPAYWRLSAAWNMIANTKDPAATNGRNWSTIDCVINDILLLGCDIIMVVGIGRPYWAGTGTPEDYGNFCAEVATRYKPGGVGILTTGAYAANSGKGVTRFEIWNEQNQSTFWGAGAPNPAVYTEYLKSAYTKIKAVSGLSGSNSQILFGGMQHIARNAFQDYWAFAGLPEIVFLQKCYDYATAQGFSLGSYFDVMCEHIYTQTDNVAYGGSVVGPAPSSSTDNLLQLVAIRTLMVAQGDSAKKIWITEAGFSTATLTEALQSTYMQDLFTYLATLAYVEVVLIYNARDVDSNSTVLENRDGMIRTDFTKKPIWTWLQSFAPTTGTGGATMSATTSVGMSTTSCDLQVRVRANVIVGQHMSASSSVGASSSAALVNLTDDLGAASSVGVSTTAGIEVNGFTGATSVGVSTTSDVGVLTMSGSTLVGINT